MVLSGAIDIAPQFQRRDRWDHARQSALIESFIVNIPVPPIYLSEDALGTYSVIDGKQRITAVSAFLNGDLPLRKLKRFPEISGMRFADLPRVMRNALDLRPLRSVTLLRGSNPDIKYEVFHRLNSGGEILNAQEIRNVIYRGPLNRLIYELAESPFLRQQLKIESERSPAYRKMLDAEFVLRFMTLADTWSDFSGDLSLSMDHFMDANRNLERAGLDRLARRFHRVLEASERIWGRRAFQRPDGASWRDQALAGMFDAQMVALDGLPDRVIARLEASPELGEQAVRRLFGDPAFEAAVRVGTNTPSRVSYRVSTMRDLLATLAA
jgi:hypothetical protein